MPPVRQIQPSLNGHIPAPTETVSPLKVFEFHGLDLRPNGGGQMVGECPFCGKEKFHVGTSDLDAKHFAGGWECRVCGEKGNNYGFLRALHKLATETTKDADLAELAADRGILRGESLREWGVCKSPVTGEWLVPGWGVDGKLNQLYRYVRDSKTGKSRLYASPGLGQYMAGINLFDPKKPNAVVCEGIWDGIALWEMLRSAKGAGDALALTGSEAASLAASTNVVSVPGCQSFPESWVPLFAGKNVTLAYDSDHAKRVAGRTVEPAGYLGAKKAAGVLLAADDKPESVSWVKWGPNGYEPDLPSGTDVRDILRADGAGTVKDRIPNLAGLLARVEPVPLEWATEAKKAKEVSKLKPMECRDWKTLIGYWRKAMRWTGDLDYMLSMLMASALSTETKGEPVWLLALAPPSSGKTTLCEAMAVADKYIFCQNELHPVYSGYMVSKDDKEDHGIIPKINNKTFIVMDGDAILKDPNRGKILSQYRSLFEGIGRKKYNNGKSFDYRINFTFIIAGTNSMREMDAAELGGRWLSVCFSEEVDYGHRDEVARMIVMRESANSKSMLGKNEDDRIDSNIGEAKKRTGGYVEYLRQNAARIMDGVEMPDGDAAAKLVQYGSLAASLRARPSKTQSEVSESEAPYRLIAQYTRLAMHLAGVMNKRSVDGEVLERVKRCALDTSRGRTLNIVERLSQHRATGLNAASLAVLTGKKEGEERDLLRYLREVGVVESFVPKVCGVRQTARWRLTERLRGLYDEVCGAEIEEGVES